MLDWLLGDRNKTKEADSADRFKNGFKNNRLVPNAMEPRAAIGDYNPSTEKLLVLQAKPTSSQLIISFPMVLHGT